jgi:hypothetical protein
MKFHIGQRVVVDTVDLESWQGRRLHPVSDQIGSYGTVRGYGASEPTLGPFDDYSSITQFYFVLLDKPCDMYEFAEYELKVPKFAIQMHEEGTCGDLTAIASELRNRGQDDLSAALISVREDIKAGPVQDLIGPLPR